MSVIKQNIIANLGGKAWQVLMSLAFVPLYIKFMGIESYGLVGIFASLLALFGVLDMGLSTTLNRELASLSLLRDKALEMRDLVRTLEIIYWGMALLIGIAVFGLSWPIAHHWVCANDLSPSEVQQALMIMGGVVAFQWPLSFYSGGLMGMQKQVLLNLISISAATFRGFGAVLILWKVSPTIQAFFAWQVFVSMLNTFTVAGFLWYSLPKSVHRSHFQKESLFRIWRFASGMTAISVTAIVLTQADKIILSKILTLEMFGYYTLATVVASTLQYFVGPVFTALFPRFSQLVSLHDQDALKELYHKGSQLVSVMILPFAIVVSFFSSEIMFLWTGNLLTVANTHGIISLLIIGTAFNGLMNLPYALQLAHAWTKLTLYTNIVASIVLVPMVYLLGSYYGALGAAAVWVILNIGYVLICIPIMHSRLLQGEKWKWYVNDVGIPMLTAIIIALIWRVCVPDELARFGAFICLVGVTSTTLILTAFATPVTRHWIAQKMSCNTPLDRNGPD